MKIISPVVDQGAGVLTVIVEVVGEELQVPADEIELKQVDSTIVPRDGGVGGSRATRVYGNASYEAGVKAREELFLFAAQALEVDPKELSTDRGLVWHKPSKRKMSFAEVIKFKGAPIYVRGYYKSAEKSHDASVSAQIAEVHVDPETGQVTLRNMISAHTTGRVINPLMHQGQVEGGVVFGLGYALTEEVMFDDGGNVVFLADPTHAFQFPIALRVVLIFFALQLLALPFLQVVGAFLLLWIGIKVVQPEDDDAHGHIEGSSHLFGAIRTIVLADAAMSLDNVIAVAGAAKGDLTLVVFGIVVSIPIIVWGSKFVLRLMDHFPVVITLGAALLGWIAGGMLVSDAALSPHLTNWPAWLHYVPSAAGALLVVMVGQHLARRAARGAPAAVELAVNDSASSRQ